MTKELYWQNKIQWVGKSILASKGNRGASRARDRMSKYCMLILAKYRKKTCLKTLYWASMILSMYLFLILAFDFKMQLWPAFHLSQNSDLKSVILQTELPILLFDFSLFLTLDDNTTSGTAGLEPLRHWVICWLLSAMFAMYWCFLFSGTKRLKVLHQSKTH